MSRPLCYGLPPGQAFLLGEIHQFLATENGEPIHLAHKINKLTKASFLNRLESPLLDVAKAKLSTLDEVAAKIAMGRVLTAIDAKSEFLSAIAWLELFEDCSNQLRKFLEGTKDMAACEKISSTLRNFYLEPNALPKVSDPDVLEVFQRGFQSLTLSLRVDFLSVMALRELRSDVNGSIAKSVLLDVNQEDWEERIDSLSQADCFDFLIDMPDEILSVENHELGKLEFVAGRVRTLFMEGLITDYFSVKDLESVPPQRLVDVFENIYHLNEERLHRNLDALGQTYAFHVDKTARSLFFGHRFSPAILDYLGGSGIKQVFVDELNEWTCSQLDYTENRRGAYSQICRWLINGGKLDLSGLYLITLPSIFDLVAHFYPSHIGEINLKSNCLELLPIGMTQLPFTSFVLHSSVAISWENPLRGDLYRLRSVYNHRQKERLPDNPAFLAIKPLL